VIAGQIAAVDGERRVQIFAEGEIGGVAWSIPGDVTAVDDKIGPDGIDVFADVVEILDEFCEACGGGEVGIGNLDQAKFSHYNLSLAIFLPMELVSV